MSQETDSLACIVVRANEVGTDKLSAAEQKIADKISNPDQRTQFTLGRIAAHRALAQLGEKTPASITKAQSGEPEFPKQYVGSISHTNGVGAAVVGKAEAFLSVGLDIEPTARVLAKDILKRIAIPAERIWAEESEAEKRIRTLQIFSAKESIFKALFPLTKKRMDFKDVFVRWEDEHNAFIGTLLTDLSEQFPAGELVLTYCVIDDDIILTSTLIAPIEEFPEEMEELVQI